MSFISPPAPREIIQEFDVMLSSRGLRALGYKKYALCELSNGKPPVMTCKKEQRESSWEAVGIIDHGENRRCSLWNGFEFCHKTLALDCRYAPGHMVRRRRAAAKEKKERREKGMKMAGLRNATRTQLPYSRRGFDKFRTLSLASFYR